MTKQKWRWDAIALLMLSLLFFIVITPSQQRLSDGSTYSRQPSGYGAWYATMEQQGTKIQRWQKPWTELITNSATAKKASTTLLQIHPQLTSPPVLDEQEQKWLSLGNKIIILGIQEKVTAANFTTTPSSPQGIIKIQSSRRKLWTIPPDQSSKLTILGDRFGAIIWQQPIGKGQLILVTTPYLGANAYQNEPGNFKFLSQLVNPAGNPQQQIYVDEYLHGYRDAEEIAKTGTGNWITYLQKTPVFVVFVQMGILLLVLLGGYNQRLGRVVPLETPAINNSEEYIGAIAAVLERANCPDFLLDTIGRAEQIKLQRSLGLGSTLVAPEVLLKVWEERIGKPSQELAQILQQQAQVSNNNPKEHLTVKQIATPTKSKAILDLLEKWQQLHIR